MECARSAKSGCALQIGSLYGLLGRLYLDRASSLSGAFQARYKKQVMPAELLTQTFVLANHHLGQADTHNSSQVPIKDVVCFWSCVYMQSGAMCRPRRHSATPLQPIRPAWEGLKSSAKSCRAT